MIKSLAMRLRLIVFLAVLHCGLAAKVFDEEEGLIGNVTIAGDDKRSGYTDQGKASQNNDEEKIKEIGGTETNRLTTNTVRQDSTSFVVNCG